MMQMRNEKQDNSYDENNAKKKKEGSRMIPPTFKIILFLFHFGRLLKCEIVSVMPVRRK